MSQHFDDLFERVMGAAVARSLGLTEDDLAQLDWSIRDIAANGHVIGHRITFAPTARQDLLARVFGLEGGRSVEIPPIILSEVWLGRSGGGR